jgi:hypothetical protein
MAKKATPRVRHKTGEMNKTELSFSMHLDIRKQAMDIKEWKFETMTFILGDDCRYTPDFEVLMANGDTVFIEVKKLWKGHNKPHWEDDALVKRKWAAQKWQGWFQFYWVYFDGSKWVYELF